MVRRFDLVRDRMGERSLRYFPRIVCLLSDPIAERGTKTMHRHRDTHVS